MSSFRCPPSRQHQGLRRRDRVASDEGLCASATSDLHPVLLIPGIGGSILNAVSTKGASERIWVRLYLADKEFKAKLWSKYNSETGKTESLDPDSHIEVPEDRYGLYSCDMLDPDFRFSVDAVNYFHVMILQLRSCGYVEGQDLFGFGYDFRQSNRLPAAMDKLLQKLKGIYEQTGKKVDVVTHSMGGLLFKSFVALHNDEVAQYVNKWVAIAAPFQGAPGFITDTLLTGVEFLKGWQSSLFVSKWSMHQLLVECPSVYELMADYSFAWESPPELRVLHAETPDDAPKEERCRDRTELVSLMGEVLKDNTISINGETIPAPLNHHILDWARETHRIWRTARLPESVEFFSIYGTNLDTPFHCQYGTRDTPLADLTDILHTEALFDCKDGDGTVPVESAMGDGLQAMYRIGVPGEHRGLLNDARVHRILNYFLKVPPHDKLYDPYTDCILLPSRKEIEAEMAAVDKQPRQMEWKNEASAVGKSYSFPATGQDVHPVIEDLDEDFVEVSTMPGQAP